MVSLYNLSADFKSKLLDVFWNKLSKKLDNGQGKLDVHGECYCRKKKMVPRLVRKTLSVMGF